MMRVTMWTQKIRKKSGIITNTQVKRQMVTVILHLLTKVFNLYAFYRASHSMEWL